MDAVIVTADNAPDLEQLLLCEAVQRSFDRLVVVDHLSRDGSADIARGAGAQLITLDQPLGYGGAVNVGARHTRGPSFAVLNPDIRIDSETVVPRLARHLERPMIGLVAPALQLPNGRLQDSARQIPTPIDLVLRRRLAPQLGVVRSSGVVPWVVGACFLVRRDAWEEVGGFDDGFFLYFEDVDLCWRLRQRGWITFLDATVRVHHMHRRASRKNLFGWAMRTHVRSATRFYRKNPRFILSRRAREIDVHPEAVGVCDLGRPHQGPASDWSVVTDSGDPTES